MSAPREKPTLDQVSDYVPGQRSIAGIATPIKLSANESPLGPSPRAIEAYHEAAHELFRYPDGAQTELRAALAEVHGLEAERVVCGNGSDELIQLLIRAYLVPGDGVVLSQHSFIMARIHALSQGAEVTTAPEPDFRISVDEILARVTASTRLVVLASPTNPCGTYLPRAELARLHAALPDNVLLLVDAAYADYVTVSDYDCGLELASTSANVFVTRTFSKLYGLAALRIGWGYGAERIVANINRIRTPFNTNAPALAAATAAVRDRDYAARIRDHNQHWLDRVSSGLRALGLTVIPSVANFVLVRFPAAPLDAAAAHRHLLQRGIIPRPLGNDGPENCLRITIGLDHENEAVLAALAAFVKQQDDA
jgi:histidinol-phosphate aminotransferase